MTSEASDTLLGGVRVIDLATSRAEMTGRVLADMGAEVIKVEPPWGTPSRHLPPFSEQEPERSLYWAAMGLGKRSVVIDLDDEAGREDFPGSGSDGRCADRVVRSRHDGRLGPGIRRPQG